MSSSPKSPVSAVVAEIRNLLADAELGAIQSIAFVAIRADGGISRGCARAAEQPRSELDAAIADLWFEIQDERSGLYVEMPQEEGNNG